MTTPSFLACRKSYPSTVWSRIRASEAETALISQLCQSRVEIFAPAVIYLMIGRVQSWKVKAVIAVSGHIRSSKVEQEAA